MQTSKPGWQTTEFWVTALLLASVALGWIGGKLDGDKAAIASAIAAGLYATSRGLAKKGAARDPRAELLETGLLSSPSLEPDDGDLLHHGAAPGPGGNNGNHQPPGG